VTKAEEDKLLVKFNFNF